MTGSMSPLEERLGFVGGEGACINLVAMWRVAEDGGVENRVGSWGLSGRIR